MWNLRKRLAASLKEKRGEKTERQFSKELGISQAALNRYLNGSQAASLDVLETISGRLKIDIVDLLRKRPGL